MNSESKPLGIIAIGIFAGYNGILLLIVGTLLIVANPPPGFPGLALICGILLVLSGTAFSAGIVGLWSCREWGRRILFWAFTVNVPMSFMAIFPMLQNTRMTVGNTILQSAVMVLSLATSIYLQRSALHATRAAQPEMDLRSPAAEWDHLPEEAPVFTFDRNHQAHQSRH